MGWFENIIYLKCELKTNYNSKNLKYIQNKYSNGSCFISLIIWEFRQKINLLQFEIKEQPTFKIF